MRLAGEIRTLKELFTEIFYDWGFTPEQSPQIHKDGDGYWINKTSLFLEADKYVLSYKTESWYVTPKVYEAFAKFYDLYEGDWELEQVLGQIGDVWDSKANLQKTTTGFSLKEVAIGKKDGQPFLWTKSANFPISETTYLKLMKLYYWWETI
jgi:hypothetical protein